ncbi:Endo-beta-1 4-xylanase Xyn10C [termite gut metagenome]|uniref:endo-1,4-beta-xylanase n=1 Tax=termite gut metagenome TaxID=433724 RepID=A0A5J4SHW4_9ZZZZ
MKYRNILSVIALSAMWIMSCDEEKMEWYKDPTHEEITEAEIPLQLVEKISRYQELNTYTNFTLGVGIDLTLYMENDDYRNIVNENFDEIAVGYHMKHGAMVNSTGGLNFGSVDALLNKLGEAGLTVYGHTLVWHQNQNAGYLNKLIAPEVIPAPAGSNLLDNGSFEEGMTDWGSWGTKTTVEISTDEHVEGLQSLKVVINGSSNAVYGMQLQSPSIPLIEGHHYQISFYIKSDIPGAVRMSFDNGLDTPPLGSFWPGNNASDKEENTISTSATWKQVIYDKDHSNNEFVAAASSVQFRLDLGLLPGVTYYIDNVIVVDLDVIDEPTIVNLIANGTFDENIEGWSKWNGTDGCNTHATGADAYSGGGALKVVNDIGDDPSNQYKVQIHANFTETFVADKKYKISYVIRSEAPGSVRCSTSGTANYQGDQSTSIVWQEITWDITAKGGEEGLNFDLGAKAGTYYIDNVVVQEVIPVEATKAALATRASGPTYIEKSDAEKTAIISAALESWIKGILGHYKDKVNAWDAVNEPMDDGKPSSLKTGIGKELASDEFYWQDYLGKDYAVTAFKLARAAGNANDILFINDYNLEQSLAKCDGLIEYVKYIEGKGATVDGIGTQMHISITSNKDNISQMFDKLGKTGKLIKISELDIQIGTASPTTEQYAQQAEMYRYVVDMYLKYIPEAQRYGITVWGISDNAKEHENWIPNDAPNLWNQDYQRKHAYKGFVDGLAGKDVSEDFAGNLEY